MTMATIFNWPKPTVGIVRASQAIHQAILSFGKAILLISTWQAINKIDLCVHNIMSMLNSYP